MTPPRYRLVKDASVPFAPAGTFSAHVPTRLYHSDDGMRVVYVGPVSVAVASAMRVAYAEFAEAARALLRLRPPGYIWVVHQLADGADESVELYVPSWRGERAGEVCRTSSSRQAALALLGSRFPFERRELASPEMTCSV